MDNDKANILKYIEMAIDMRIAHVYFAQSTPIPKNDKFKSICTPRFIFLLDGGIDAVFAYNGKEERTKIESGSAVFSSRMGWLGSDTCQKYSLLSFSIAESCTRCIHFHHNKQTDKPDTVLYVTAVDEPIRKLFEVAESIGTDSPSTRHASMAFLYLLRDFIENAGDFVWEEDRICENIDIAINHNFQANIGLEDLAEIIGIPAYKISRILRKKKNMTFPQYLNHFRLNHACRLLLNHDAGIAEIAQSCGFSYPNYFIRVFKNRYQVTPHQYRKKLR